MTTDGLTTYELDGRIATITLDDGKVNAFSIPMLRAVHAELDQAERDSAITVITGREGFLSAGFDLKVFAAGGEPVREMLVLGATLFERLLGFKTPVVIASPGHAMAAGAFLPLAADARIAADGEFRICLNEVKIGLTMPWFAIELARQRLTRRDFDRAVVTAYEFTPSSALAAGFFDEVVAPADLHAAALETAERLAGLNAEAHAATKLRARKGALDAMRLAIETELLGEQFSPA
jgi:enoyl-CoA hydratase